MESRIQCAQVALLITLGGFADILKCSVTLSPFEVAQVCVGQEVELTCVTSETFLVWNFVPPLVNAQGVSIPQDWFIASRDLSQQIQILTVNSTSFTFMRTSTQNSSSLVSTLTIINSSNALNMAAVSCTEIVGIERAMSALTTILIIGDTHTVIINPPSLYVYSHVVITASNLSPLEVSTRPVFEINNVSVTLEWMSEEGVSYSVTADQVMEFKITQRIIVNLTVPYNTPTNVNITATSCGRSSETAITSINLAYGRCADPSLSIKDTKIQVMGYDNLALNGTVVTLSCPPGVLLNGPNSSKCMGNGEWEPDPREMACNEIPQCPIPSSHPNGYIIPYNSTDERIRVTFACQSDCGGDLKSSLELHTAICASNGDLEVNPLDFSGDKPLTVIVISVAAVFLVSSVIIFIIGFVCGQWFSKKVRRPLSQACGANPPKSPPVPIYESTFPDTTHEEQTIKLEENVAYGPCTHAGSP